MVCFVVWSRKSKILGDNYTMIIKSKKKLICESCHKEINKENLSTPDNIFSKCMKIHNTWSDLDLCATSKNSKCDHFFREDEDSLKQSWQFFCYGSLWCNPPHKQTKKFIIKACKEFLKSNRKLKIVFLIPINTLTSNYAKQYILPYVKISNKNILTGRIKFLCEYCGTPTKLNSVNGYVTIIYANR